MTLHFSVTRMTKADGQTENTLNKTIPTYYNGTIIHWYKVTILSLWSCPEEKAQLKMTTLSRKDGGTHSDVITNTHHTRYKHTHTHLCRLRNSL